MVKSLGQAPPAGRRPRGAAAATPQVVASGPGHTHLVPARPASSAPRPTGWPGEAGRRPQTQPGDAVLGMVPVTGPGYGPAARAAPARLSCPPARHKVTAAVPGLPREHLFSRRVRLRRYRGSLRRPDDTATTPFLASRANHR